MCFGALFAGSGQKRKKSQSNTNEKRRNSQRDPRHYERIPAVTQVSERKWPERPDIKRSKETYGKAERRMRPTYPSNSGARHRPPLAVNVPPMWYRGIGSTSSNSSEEMLLNPRPDRSAHDKRQHHARHTSQSTLRGRGAKRQRTTDTRCNDRSSSFSSPRTHKKRSQPRTGEYSPQGNRSTRQPPTSHHAQHQQYHTPRSEFQPESSRSRRHAPHQYPSTRANTGARRDPTVDRRFAVLAATNTALEHLRREAFAQPSPPPPPRLRRVQGVHIPASSIPFQWDCISSQTQSTARHGEGSSRQRSRR